MYKITKDNTKVFDSYLIPNKSLDNIVKAIIEERKAKRYIVTRSVESYKNEIRFHNRMYKLGLFKSHTKDTDLEEPISFIKELIYGILGR